MKLFLVFCVIKWSFTLVLGKLYFPPELEVLIPTASSQAEATPSNNNHTRFVIPKSDTIAILRCEASYPIMWAIDSLEHEWVRRLHSARRVKDVNDRSNSMFVMSVLLHNAANASQEPGEFLCHAVDISRPSSVSVATVFWERGEFPSWNYLIKNATSEGIPIYWKLDSTGSDVAVIIPCYTLNEKEVTLELFKKLNERTLKPLIPELARFEPYVGFFLNSSQIESREEIYECHAGIRETSGDLDSTVSGFRQISPQKITFRLRQLKTNSEQTVPKAQEIVSLISQFQKTSEYLTLSPRYENNLLDTIECCGTGESRSTLYEQECSEPLLCLTRTHVEESSGTRSNFRMYAYSSSKNCAELKYIAMDNPVSFRCKRRPGYLEETSSHEQILIVKPKLEFATMYIDNGNASSYIQYSFRSINDHQNKGAVWETIYSNPVFYIGEIVEFQCKASGFLFSAGVLWELEWINGTRGIFAATPTSGIDRDICKLSINNDQIRTISCNVPQWNISDWTTLTVPFDNIRASSAPIMSELYQNVTLYDVSETDFGILKCNSEGIPRPSLSWNSINSSIFKTFENNTEEYPRLTSKSGVPEVANSGLIVKLASDLDWNNINKSDMSQNFSCTASNVAGSVTKMFSIDVIRVFVPTFANGTKEVALPQIQDAIVLKCQLLQGVPNPTFSWQKHGRNISIFNNYEVQSFDMESHLILSKITYEDEDEYECTAENIGGAAIKSFNIRARDQQQIQQNNWHVSLTALLCIIVIILLILVGYLVYVYIYRPRVSRLHERDDNSVAIFQRNCREH